MTTGHSGCPSITELTRRQPRPTLVCRKKLCSTSVSGPTCTLVSVTRLTTYLLVLDTWSTNVSQSYLAGAARCCVVIVVMAGRASYVSCSGPQISHKMAPLRINDGRAPRQGGYSYGSRQDTVWH